MIPGATYRLQLHAGFDFAATAAHLPHLRDLGVDTVYLSPVFAARAGSAHGYDVIDPTAVNPELGGRAGFEALRRDAFDRGMTLLLDIVPNHQAATTSNPRWAATLQGGPESPAARTFDIDWSVPAGGRSGRLVWPILGDEPRREIARGALRLERRGDAVRLVYGDEALPLREPVVDVDLRDPRAVTGALERQHYFLAPAATGLRNYRRFFDIDHLVGVRVEDAAVFAQTHRLVAELVAEPGVAGVRVDHVDGLADPAGYLSQLRALVGPDRVIVVEKILGPGETLDPTWPVDGTTGYEFLAATLALHVDPAGHDALVAAVHAETGLPSFAAVERQAKMQVLEQSFEPELARLVEWARAALCEPARRRGAVRDALAAITVALDTYRTYGATGALTAADAARVHAARDRAVAHGSVDERLLDRLADLLVRAPGDDATRQLRVAWQQLCGPVMAKGREDTACYRYPVLLAASEVGCDPADRGDPTGTRLHGLLRARVHHHGHPLDTLATHDTKRSGDVRTRLAVLSELPDEFDAALRAWRAAPDRSRGVRAADERLVAQTLIGVWPPAGEPGDGLVRRVDAYLRKALREGKEVSSWIDPDERYEATVGTCAREALAPGSAFRAAFADLTARVAFFGMIGGLADRVVMAAAPGIPDVYEGTERPRLSLTDPDNRRPVDFDAGAVMLARLGREHGLGALVGRLRSDWTSGALTLHVLSAALQARRADPALFGAGSYEPLEVGGARHQHVFAFARRHEDRVAIAAVALRVARAGNGDLEFPLGARFWADTAIALPAPLATQCHDVISGRHIVPAAATLAAADIFGALPVALLRGP